MQNYIVKTLILENNGRFFFFFFIIVLFVRKFKCVDCASLDKRGEQPTTQL